MLDPYTLKKDFPILNRPINGKSLIYLDNASTTQKPAQVIEALKNYYETMNANVHRSVYKLSEKATEAYEATREKTADFIGAKSPNEIIFTGNATEAINLIAYTWGEENIQKGDEIIVSALEHHSNFVPWQQLALRKKAKLQIIPLKDDLTLDIEAYKKLLSTKTKLVAITGMSNVLGAVPPVKEMITLAHRMSAKTLIDGAQSVAHSTTNVRDLDCDFMAFSAHKMLGPTGVGVLYSKHELPPFLFGGGMIETVTPANTTFADLPYKFEAGTPNIADVIAFKTALDYLEKIGLDSIAQHEQKLAKYAIEKFSKYPEVKLYLPPNPSGIVSFTINGIHPHDIATIFDNENIAIRAGHHCAQPLMQILKVPATARMSFYLYNTEQDIDHAEKSLQKTIKTFK